MLPKILRELVDILHSRGAIDVVKRTDLHELIDQLPDVEADARKDAATVGSQVSQDAATVGSQVSQDAATVGSQVSQVEKAVTASAADEPAQP